MAKLYLLFVYEHDDNLIDEVVGKAVSAVEGGDWPVHVAAYLFNGLFEAIEPRVTVSDCYKYDRCRTKAVAVDVPDLDAATQKAAVLMDKPYGLLSSCIAGGWYSLFHRVLHLGRHNGKDCSEVATIVLRAGGVPLYGGRPAYTVTPKDLYIALQ